MKIMFAWRKIDNVAGGVERFMSGLMNAMAGRGHDVVLFTWDQKGATSYYPLDDRIRWLQMDIGRPEETGSWKTRFERMFYTRKIIRQEKPDVMLCFESGIFVSLRLFLIGFKIPMISAERNAPTRHAFSDKGHKKHINHASLLLADKITTQIERYREGYPSYLSHKMVSIPNPVKPAQSLAVPAADGAAQKILLCVSRISFHQKNPQILLQAFSKIAQDYPQWVLYIAGDGEEPEVRKFKELVVSSGIADRIKTLGAVKDVESLYASAHLFCLPSRYEGFPNALAEALSHGLPCVGFKDCAGVCDLIQDGVTGILAEGNSNVETLSVALAKLMGDDVLRGKMGVQAVESMKPYAPDIVFDRWENLLKSVAKQ